jgi:hypothetical protein
MNFKSTALLFGLVLGMLWLFGLMLDYRRITQDVTYVVPSLHDSADLDIVSVKMVQKEKDQKPQEYVFTKEKDTWKLEQPPLKPKIKVENFKVDQIIRQIKDVRKDDEADVTNDLATYGLDHPSLTVTLRGAEKKGDKEAVKEWQFFVGNTSPDKTFVYVNSSDKPNKVMGARRSTLDSVLFKDVAALRSKSLLDAPESSVRYIDVKGEPGELELKKTEEGTWQFLKPNYGVADFEGKTPPASPLAAVPPKQEGGIKGLLGAINAIRVGGEGDFEPLKDSPLSSYGLEEGKEWLRIQLGTGGIKKEELTKETLLVGQKVSSRSQQYYARMANDDGVVKIDAKLLEPILKVLDKPGQLRSRDLIPIDTKDVDAVDIRHGKELKEVLKLRHPEGKDWKLYVGKESHKADEKGMKSLLETLRGKGEIREFFDESEADAKKKDAERGLDQPTADVSLWSGGIDKKEDKGDKDEKKEKKEKDKEDAKEKDRKADDAEPSLRKDAKPAVTLTFGKTEKDLVYVKRETKEGIVSRLAVPKSILEKALPAEGPLAFFDTALPQFDLDQVTQLEIDKGSDKLVVQKGHGDQAERWLLKDRKDYAGRNFADTPQVTAILQNLGNLHVQKWISKLDPKEDLDKFGLKKPAITVTVMVTKDKLPAAAVASMMALAGPPVPGRPVLAAVSLLAGKAADKGEAVVFKFGKETKEKDTPAVYALRSEVHYLFQVAPDLLKTLREADLRDRSWLTLMQPCLDAGLLGTLAGPQGPGQLVAASPLLTGSVLSFDAAKVKEIKLAVRTKVELRHLAFQRAKDKTWEDKSGLQEFTLEQKKVNQLVTWLADLRAERFIFLTPGPREEQKLTAKDAAVKIDLVFEDGKTVTFTAGAPHDKSFYASTSAWPNAVFLVPQTRIEPLQEGAGYFGKARVAAR